MSLGLVRVGIPALSAALLASSALARVADAAPTSTAETASAAPSAVDQQTGGIEQVTVTGRTHQSPG